MKNSNEFINSSVFKVNKKYTEMQNKTKELFFKCLDEGRSLSYFETKLDQLWGNLDRSFMQSELDEYEAIIHENNMTMLQIREMPIKEVKQTIEFFSIVAAAVILATEKKFTNRVKWDYEHSSKSVAYETDKKQYLKLKVEKYNDDKVVPYYIKKTGEIRYVSASTYNAMIHNTNMTRTAWNTTLNDADNLGFDKFYIPYHSFSCPHCLDYQGKMMTKNDVINLVGYAEEQEGDILHPNCKCTLHIYQEELTNISKPKFDIEELEEQYHIRQKVNKLTLEKSKILTDIRIQKKLGNFDEVDKLNQKRNKVNTQIRELQDSLPTSELKKQVVTINR